MAGISLEQNQPQEVAEEKMSEQSSREEESVQVPKEVNLTEKKIFAQVDLTSEKAEEAESSSEEEDSSEEESDSSEEEESESSSSDDDEEMSDFDFEEFRKRLTDMIEQDNQHQMAKKNSPMHYKPQKPRGKPKIIEEDITNCEIKKAGIIHSVVDNVISFGPTENVKNTDILNYDTVICLGDKTKVGRLEDILGLVEKPLYTVITDVEKVRVEKGMAIFWVPSLSKLLLQSDIDRSKPSDLAPEDAEEFFSDDEEEKKAMKKKKDAKVALQKKDGVDWTQSFNKQRFGKRRLAAPSNRPAKRARMNMNGSGYGAQPRRARGFQTDAMGFPRPMPSLLTNPQKNFQQTQSVFSPHVGTLNNQPVLVTPMRKKKKKDTKQDAKQDSKKTSKKVSKKKKANAKYYQVGPVRKLLVPVKVSPINQPQVTINGMPPPINGMQPPQGIYSTGAAQNFQQHPMMQNGAPPMMQNFPQDPMMQNFPQDPMMQNFPQDPMMQNFPQDPMMQNFPQDPMMQNFQQHMPPYQQFSNAPPQPFPQPMPQMNPVKPLFSKAATPFWKRAGQS